VRDKPKRERERSSLVERERAKALAKPRTFRSQSRHGEVLAMDPKAIGFSYLWTGVEPVTINDQGVATLKINGPLEHHRTFWWDSYESILERLEATLTGEILILQHNAMVEACWWRDIEPMQAGSGSPPKAVILEIDSPGGESAGATYCHRKIRSLRREIGIPIYSYANEGAASAAYEIACAADEVWTCDTGVVGSVGVVATMFDTTSHNEKTGVLVELITSGEQKADYHADREFTDPIRARVQKRVDELARIFFDVVASSRGASIGAVESLQAATFCGDAAVEAGLADGVMGLDQFREMVARTVNVETSTASDEAAE
jgi:hypothetical protein